MANYVDDETMNVTGDVVYEREEALLQEQPEFKPGKAPHYLLGNELLNGQVNWLVTLGEILATGQLTLSAIAQEIGLQTNQLVCVLENDVQHLTFNAGAKLLALYEKFVVGPCMIV